MLYSEQDSVKVDDIAGLAEVCELIGYTDGHITHLLQTEPDFPRPLTHLKSGRIWDASKVRAWRESYVPRKGDRPFGSRLDLGGTEQPVARVDPVPTPEDRKAKLDALLGGLA